MTWTLIVRGHGRWKYAARALQSIDDVLGVQAFDRRILSLDGGCEAPPESVRDDWEVLQLPERRGLAANLAQAWGALGPGDEWVFDTEEDFVLLEAPLADMALTLRANRDLAQMALVRQPWSPEEHEAGGLLYGPNLQGQVTDAGGWLRQERIFTLNPYVAHASLLRSLQPAVETSLTAQCRERDLAFGYWGSVTDQPRVLHIGAEGGMGSSGWAA